jgi:diamine N-acetyltransferase
MALMLKDSEILLRAVEPEDLEFLYECENNPEIWHLSNTLSPYSRFVLKQYIADSQNDIFTNKQLRLIICPNFEPERPLGAIDLFDIDPHHHRAGIGIVIHYNSERQKGYANRALNLLIGYCFNFLHLHQLYCTTTPDNFASIKLFSQNGFVECGRKKEWLYNGSGYVDEIMFQLIKPE